ncbi:ABC transporter ATP-binding protein [Marinoscillum furvescens]|uniref:Putative ABC transport system ATP-binding protein n=1 Tax=Marinoscillum furvescens DSM 4134 TaxID=1122208 RepID=A0A3D9L532_MARFU|nr:ATP-binding cassette domain-containing protein [Marinoscillum furvescens]RED99435.1 putative ABC transport system ATP-binding protein [Marinoscillum furvescens DSM 4134]
MIRIKELSYRFDEQKELSFPDWSLTPKEHALILGPSGGGKTTLLHLMSGLLKPTTGEVMIGDTCISDLSNSRLDRFRGDHIGFVFQKPHLIPSLTVKANIRLATFLGKTSADKVADVMEDLGIADLAHRAPHQISQGQAQRVAIARAVVNKPVVIFGDEPTASLDDQSCEAVVDLLKAQARACGASLVLATHDYRVKSQIKNHLNL